MKTIVYLSSVLALCSSCLAADPSEFLDKWLAAQKELKTWSAELTQTRKLKTLKMPLRNEGRLIFAAPNRFRWELGEPPQTIAIRGTNALRVIYPKLKRAEHYPLDGAENEPWAHALALMDAGFPESRASLEERFHVRSISETGDAVIVRLEPRTALAKQFMKSVELVLRTSDYAMVGNELEFSDGSILKNEFRAITKNPGLPANAFDLEVPSDYTIVQPLSQ